MRRERSALLAAAPNSEGTRTQGLPSAVTVRRAPGVDVMIIEKPALNRDEMLADEARQSRIALQLNKVEALLVDSEELAPPMRWGNVIEIQITRRNGAGHPEGDVLKMLVEQSS